MTGPDVDCLIAGAGCAGLSLAVQLTLSPDWSGSVLLVDAREEYARDRTWCFWDVEPHPFEGAVTHSWNRWVVRSGGRTVECGSGRFKYQYLPSDRFYDEALRILEAAPDVDIRLGTRIDALEAHPDGGVAAITTSGPIRAGIAFDSRFRFDLWSDDGSVRDPADPEQSESPSFAGGILLQHFAGAVIQLESDAFDPDEALLMDFDVEQGPAIHFVYVLPLDRRTALVEDTWLSPAPFSAPSYHERIADYVTRRFGADSFDVLHAERGVIPLAEPRTRIASDAGVIQIGVRGGLARPSSGYAFLAIQRHSRALARWMAGGRVGSPPEPYSRRSVFLDRVFVSYIRRNPAAAPDLFVRMFSGVDPDALVRFLTDAGTPADDLRVMRSLPGAPLIREALRTRRRAPCT
jgi:lycopene beta-cyclase